MSKLKIDDYNIFGHWNYVVYLSLEMLTNKKADEIRLFRTKPMFHSNILTFPNIQIMEIIQQKFNIRTKHLLGSKITSLIHLCTL